MKKTFIVMILIALVLNNIIAAKPEVRGVWVPDPQYTDVLKSYQNVVDFVSMLDTLNFNSVFVEALKQKKTPLPLKPTG